MRYKLYAPLTVYLAERTIPIQYKLYAPHTVYLAERTTHVG